MSRYFAELAYNGASYIGWQNQPGQKSVQSVIEHALSTILNTPLEITGCGRTDTGVHASYYIAHFDFEGDFPEGFLRRINKFLPPDIVIYRFSRVPDEAHARFDARERQYHYFISDRKDPFREKTVTYFPFFDQLDLELLKSTATLIQEYQDFFPFCKSNSDAKTMRCAIHRAEWELQKDGHELIFTIAADRFLRGMVRLIVGMALNVGMGKISMAAVRHALDTQTRLAKSSSAPPEGLFLSGVTYEYLEPCIDF